MKQQLLSSETQSVRTWKTKLKWILFASLLLPCFNSSAQLISTYTFATATGATMDAMSSPTVTLIGGNNDDSVSALTTFASIANGSGFTFLFDGNTYTSFSVNSNGSLCLGTRITAPDSANSLATSVNNPKICPYYDNLHTGTVAGGGKVHCKMIGSSPSRKLVIEWFETVPKSASGAANARFQVWLFESTHTTTKNLIQFVYGSGLVTNGNTLGYSIGIVNSSTDFQSVTTSTNLASIVTANNTQNTAITSGRTYTFTPPASPGCAGSLAPATGATNQAITTTLSWAAGTGTTTGYDVYFGTAASPPQVVTNQAGTTYNPGTLLAGTQYFWKIVPRNASGPAPACSTIVSFTTLAVPPCATTFAPANGTTSVPALTPTALTWVSGGGTVTGYDVYLDTNTTPVTLVSSNQAGTSYTPGALRQNQIYRWKIVPRNSSGPATAACTITNFTTLAWPTCATGLAPASGATNQAITTTLSWTTVAGVTGYDVYFGTASSPPIVSTAQAGLTFNPGTLLAGTTYFWKVAPRNGSGPDTACSVISFSTLAAPACATGLTPATGATGQVTTTTLSWTAVAGVTGYDVFFGTAASPPQVTTNQAAVTYNPGTLLPNTTYFWKIAPRNASGPATGCSTLSFTTLALPSCTGSLSPTTGATGQSVTPVLSWASVALATSYDVYFGTAASPPIVSTAQAGTTYTPGTLLPGTTYFWQVVPKNSSGAATGCSVISFTTLALPSCATGLTPATGATGQVITTTLSWTAVAGVTGYDVYFGTAASPPLVNTNQVAVTYNPGTLLPNTTYFWKIAPRNASGPSTSCSTLSFTTLAIPSCASGLAPASGATSQAITTTLSWTAVSIATSYDVYFGTAASPPIVSTSQAGTTYNPGTLLPGTQYFWQVVPKNSSGTATGCSVISFTTLALPSCATGLAPATGATGQVITTTLSWTAVAGVTGYDVFFGTAASPPQVTTNQAAITYNPGTLLPNTTYFWKIAPRNSSGPATGCSTLSFTTLALPSCTGSLSPTTGATGQSVTPVLSWASVALATSYDVYFGTAASPPIVSTAQAGTTYTPGTLLPGTTYFWQVVPKNSSGAATGCSVISFTTLALPSCATGLTPATGATGQVITTTLSWTAVAGVTGYDVYFGTAASPPLVNTNQVAVTYNPGTLLPNTTYFWKIAPRNASGPSTSCSTLSFTTLAIPSCASGLAPASGATSQAITTTLSWTAVSIATSYDVYFGTAASPPIVSTSQAGTTYNPGTLLPGTQYFWQVVPKNSSGSSTGCSVISFTTLALPACATGLTPANTATNQAITTTLSWTAVAGVTGYDVFFGTAASPPQVTTNQAAITYNPGALLPNTTYFWKIAPRNSSGPSTSCTTISFTTLAIPSCASGLAPANAATNQVITTTLSWTATAGATSYDVSFGTAASPPIVSTGQAGTTYNPGTLLANTTYFWKITPKNSSGAASGCSTISFTTLATAPCATTFAPVNGTTGVPALTPTTLSWASGGGTVTGYDVYLDTLAAPVKIVSTNQPGTTYIPGALLPGRQYWWKIAPRNSSGITTACTITSFTTLAVPPCATTFAPVNGTTGVPALNPTTLSWASGGGTVTGYDVYLDTLASLLNLASANQPETTFDPDPLVPNKLYYWKVVPRNGSGPATANCTIITFTTLAVPSCATGLVPANGATNQPVTTTFSWAAVAGATGGYDVYFGSSTPPLMVSNDQSGTTYDPGTLLPSTTYYWQVSPNNGSGPNGSCAINSFTTLPLPNCATTFAPATASTNLPITTTLSWATGGGTVTGYDIYFGTSSTPPLVITGQAGTTYNPGTLLPNTTYYWQIAPRNSGGATSGCTILSFTTLPLPVCATTLSPANAATSLPLTTTLSWASGGAPTPTGYDVYFGTAVSPPIVSTGQAGTTYNPGTLQPGTTYYWKIVPKNSSGGPSGCSIFSFTTLPLPVCVANASPANGAAGVAITSTLSWTSGGAPTPTGYDVYFGTAASPPLVSTNQAGTTFNPGTLLNGTTYYWKVVPRNASGLATGCTVNSFITIFPGVPVCAINLSPANGTSGLATSTSLSWASGGTPAPTSYDVYLSTSQALVTSSSPGALVTNVTGTTYAPALVGNTTYYWKIIAKNAAGVSAGCSVNQFTTFGLLNYDVTRNQGISYNSISATGNKVPAWRGSVDTDDNLSDTSVANRIPIGFTFYYQGTARTNLLVSTNGFVTFNTTTTSNGNASGTAYGPANASLSTTGSTGSISTLAPFYDDLVCTGNPFNQAKLDSSIKYLTAGIAPNRIFTIEWIGMEQYNNPGPDLNFQVKLYEGSNNIEFVYGTMQGFDGTKNSTYSYSTGINASVISVIPTAGQLLTQNTANTRNFSVTAANTLNIIPDCNSSILFTPGAYTPYVPGSGTVANDDPATATVLQPNSLPCTNLCGTYYTTVGSTYSSDYFPCTGIPNNDVWFTFAASSPSTTIKVRGSGGFDPAFELFDNSLTSIVCQNTLIGPTSGPGMTETLNTTTLTTGSNYYVRVYNFSGGTGVNGTFSICINATPEKPVNDSCPGAISLTPSLILNPITGTNTNVATAQLSAPSPCNSTNADDDVWYKFIAPAPIATITVQSGAGFNAALQTFSGGCGSLTTLQCADATTSGGAENINLTNLAQNGTYYVRVYHSGAGAGSGNFTIGVTSLPPQCPTDFSPPNATDGVSLGGTRLSWSKGVNASSYDVYLDTIDPPQIMIASGIPDTTCLSGPLHISDMGTYYWLVVSRNSVDTSSGCVSNQFAPSLTDVSLWVKVYIEGFYLGNGVMRPVLDPINQPTITDSIILTFRDTIAPFDSLYGFATVIDTAGYANMIFPAEALGSYYYVVVTHRNAIKTWSMPLEFETSDQVFDLTSPPDTTIILRDGNRPGRTVRSVRNQNSIVGLNSSSIIQSGLNALYRRNDLFSIDDATTVHVPGAILNLSDVIVFISATTP